jgi:hypothetical protein
MLLIGGWTLGMDFGDLGWPLIWLVLGGYVGDTP